MHLEPSPELIVERQIASVCHEAMAALASDPYLLARLEAYLGHPIAVLLARFNVGRAICGAGALVALAGPQAFVASSIICGTVMLLEAVGADFEVCPGDFDCDGVPDADDPPPDPGPGGDDGDTYDPGCTSCQPRST